MTARAPVVLCAAAALALAASGEASATGDGVLVRATVKLVRTDLSGTIVQSGTARVAGGASGRIRVTSRSSTGGTYATRLVVRAGGSGTLRASGRVRYAPDGARYRVSGTVKVTGASGVFRGATAIRVSGNGTTSPARLRLSLARG